VRTKHTEVLNKGRLEFFENSGMVSGYQYSAIMDDQTSDICRGLHGKKFKVGEEPIPPMHFNCRSILIPITKFEDFKPSKTVGKIPIQDFIDENVGTGFAVK
jgi:NAD+--asparagine ADP-ribosyltransferase